MIDSDIIISNEIKKLRNYFTSKIEKLQNNVQLKYLELFDNFFMRMFDYKLY